MSNDLTQIRRHDRAIRDGGWIRAFLRLDVEAWSGKQKRASEDFPGAFWFEDVVGAHIPHPKIAFWGNYFAKPGQLGL